MIQSKTSKSVKVSYKMIPQECIQWPFYIIIIIIMFYKLEQQSESKYIGSNEKVDSSQPMNGVA